MNKLKLTPAATVLILRDSQVGMEVLMVKRSKILSRTINMYNSHGIIAFKQEEKLSKSNSESAFAF